MKKYRKSALVISILMLLTSACGSDDGGPAGGDSEVTEATSTTVSSDTGSNVTVDSVIEACLATNEDIIEAAQPVDTSEFVTEPPWVVGFSANTLFSNSYITYFTHEVRYAVSQEPRIERIIELDANYSASQQVSDIQSLIQQDVSVILFSVSDRLAIEPALVEAREAGIPTVQVLDSFNPMPGAVATVTVDLFQYYVNSAARLFDALGGEGEVAMVRTIAGISEDAVQTEAVNCVLDHYPGIEIVDEQFGSYNTPDAQTAAEAWAVRFPDLDGVLSVYAETSVGVYNAFSAVGKMDSIEVSPNNAANGWLKLIVAEPDLNLGGVDYPPSIGANAIEVIAELLSGGEVQLGTLAAGEFIPPEEYAAFAQPDKSDTYWPNDLPPEFQPSE